MVGDNLIRYDPINNTGTARMLPEVTVKAKAPDIVRDGIKVPGSVVKQGPYEINKFLRTAKTINENRLGVAKTLDTMYSYLPFVGTVQDGMTLYDNPSWKNAGYFGWSLAADTMPFLKLTKGINLSKGILGKIPKYSLRFNENWPNYYVNYFKHPSTYFDAAVNTSQNLQNP